MDTRRISKCLEKIQGFYGQTLSPDLQEDFVEFCLDNFQGIAQIEKAVTLLIQKETNYGRIPAFARMLHHFQEYMQSNRAEYRSPESASIALPPAEDRGVSPERWAPLSELELAAVRRGEKNGHIERLRAKIKVANYLKHPLFLEEAIAEATKRRIPLDLIGVTERVAA
jgi:hypothetical protein